MPSCRTRPRGSRRSARPEPVQAHRHDSRRGLQDDAPVPRYRTEPRQSGGGRHADVGGGAAFRLESSDAVTFYARNDHLGLGPVRVHGRRPRYEPDFLVRLANGLTLILEIKGFEDDQAKAKRAAAKRWLISVNNWGELGKWAFHVSRNPLLLDKELDYLRHTSLQAAQSR